MYLRRRERHEPFGKYRIAVCDTFYMYSGRLFHDELPCAGKTCLWVFCCRNGSLSGIQFLYHDSLWKYGASKCYFIHDRTAVFVLILLITKDKISQTVFNFWLWINIYDIIANFSAFINDYTLKDAYFLTALRFVLFGGYFILYNKHLKAKHRMLMDRLKVNWWIFSFIPMSFTGLICLVNYYFWIFTASHATIRYC